MDIIREEFSEFLRATLTRRRIFALAIAIVCAGVCIAVVLGRMQMPIWQTALVLVLGLLFFEWAG